MFKLCLVSKKAALIIHISGAALVIDPGRRKFVGYVHSRWVTTLVSQYHIEVASVPPGVGGGKRNLVSLSHKLYLVKRVTSPATTAASTSAASQLVTNMMYLKKTNQQVRSSMMSFFCKKSAILCSNILLHTSSICLYICLIFTYYLILNVKC